MNQTDGYFDAIKRAGAEQRGHAIDERKREPGTIILRIVAIRITDDDLPDEIVANVDLGPSVVRNVIPTAPGQKAWIGFAIEGARKVYASMKSKGWI